MHYLSVNIAKLRQLRINLNGAEILSNGIFCKYTNLNKANDIEIVASIELKNTRIKLWMEKG